MKGAYERLLVNVQPSCSKGPQHLETPVPWEDHYEQSTGSGVCWNPEDKVCVLQRSDPSPLEESGDNE